MPRTLTIRRAGAGEAAALAETLAQAFADDPICAWVLPDEAVRPELTRAFFGVFAEFVLEAGEAHIDETGAGAALWLATDPADSHEDDGGLGAAIAEACGPFADRIAIIGELQAAAHPSHAVHAYLPFIGVAPEGQGRGIGSSLLEARLRDLDKAGLPAYLEASTIQSARLYRRHGFEHMDNTIDLPDGPSLYPMWREPARR